MKANLSIKPLYEDDQSYKMAQRLIPDGLSDKKLLWQVLSSYRLPAVVVLKLLGSPSIKQTWELHKQLPVSEENFQKCLCY